MAKSKKGNNKDDHPIDKATQEKQWLEELKNSEAVQKYLAGFNPDSVDSFLKDYLFRKSIWHSGATYLTGNIENEQIQWVNTAFEHLEIIQQKKLFDAQCLWRAEKIKFAGVEICEDFKVWENDVLNCPFIEPVNEEDIDLYALYLRQNNADAEVEPYGEWQEYDEIKEAYNTSNANRNFPEWYDFHNGRTGNGTLMLLPDIRGEKEEFYCDLHFDHQHEQNKDRDREWEEKREKRPWLHGYEDDTLK